MRLHFRTFFNIGQSKTAYFSTKYYSNIADVPLGNLTLIYIRKVIKIFQVGHEVYF